MLITICFNERYVRKNPAKFKLEGDFRVQKHLLTSVSGVCRESADRKCRVRGDLNERSEAQNRTKNDRLSTQNRTLMTG